MKLDYTLLNEPTALLQRLADAEAKLEAVRLLPEKWGALKVTGIKAEVGITYKVCAKELKAAIGEKHD